MTPLEKKFMEREKQRQRLFQSLQNCDRRTFLSLAGRFAAVAAAVGVVAYGLLAFTLGVRYLKIVDHRPVAGHEPAAEERSGRPALGTTD